MCKCYANNGLFRSFFVNQDKYLIPGLLSLFIPQSILFLNYHSHQMFQICLQALGNEFRESWGGFFLNIFPNFDTLGTIVK